MDLEGKTVIDSFHLHKNLIILFWMIKSIKRIKRLNLIILHNRFLSLSRKAYIS